MPFTIEDFHDLVRLVTERPEWRADLRRLVLTDELLSLPEQLAKFQLRAEDRFQELAERLVALEERTEKRFQELTARLASLEERTERRFQELAERLVALEERTEKRFQELTERLATLEEHTERRFQELAERLVALEERTEKRFQAVEGQIASLTVQVGSLTKVVDRLVDEVGELKGESLENRYRLRASAYFSRLLRKIHVLSPEELARVLDEAVDRGALLESEAEDVLLANLVVRGKRREDGGDGYLVVEVSWGVGLEDVVRASRRSALLSKAGLATVPVVAGKRLTDEARQFAHQQHVRQVTDGQAISVE